MLGKAGYSGKWHLLYGDEYLNLPYYKNNKIINSFKKGGINYNEEIGDINKGKDYEKNERNFYDLYIPYSCLKNKNKFNGIFLFIHGGAWHHGKKEYASFLTLRYAKYGYITAQMNHTYLNEKNKDCSIFKIIDEITACIESIKSKLKSFGFDENKLEIALGGMSSGAHLSLLYGYSIKNKPLPLRFLINYCGPLSLEIQFWYKLGNNVPPLYSIDIETIDKCIKEKKIVNIFDNEIKLLDFMNRFIGYKYTKKELDEMMINKKINLENEKFKELQKIVKYCYPSNFINENSVPTLCYYGGMDTVVGVAQYAELKKRAEKFGNIVELVYMKNGEHMLMDYKTENGKNAIREIHYQILNFAKSYFTRDI
jgi:acetyl esterase/lipase